MKHIRNFSITAHIDHGKSTLADRLIEFCSKIERRKELNRVLDSMDIEKERGITIKAQTARLIYDALDGETYCLNLIDTPGHVDFSYEVSRSLAAGEGSLLVVDATQGVEAQTLANAIKAIDSNHEIVPVLNKIDLPSANVEKVKEEIEEIIGIDASDAVLVSAKTGLGVRDVLEAIVNRLPAPAGSETAPLKALLIDSWYDPFLGIAVLIRIVDGKISKGMKISLMSNGMTYQVDQLGVFIPEKQTVQELAAGEIGFFTASIKDIEHCKVGDTITEVSRPCSEKLPGFKEVSCFVFCSFFPADTGDFRILREALEKLHLNDSSFSFEPETSAALGHGFRCGFLGILHLEVVQERLEREFSLDLTATAPSVAYNVYMTDGELKSIHNPADMPDPQKIAKIEEPWVRASIMAPESYIGPLMTLCEDRRGEKEDMSFSANSTAILTYKLPLSEIIFDFYDKIKSISNGYASLDWYFDKYIESEIKVLNILVNSENVDALSCIVHKDRIEFKARAMCAKLKELIPRQQFKVPIQAAIGSKIIARETIAPYRKDVTAKLYGGDVTRRMKLLEKQKKGKKKMQSIGNIDVPKSVFIEALKIDD